MKRYFKLAVLFSAMLITALASAQSLGDAARAAKSEKKPASRKVYTNDDFASTAPVTSASDKTSPEGAAAPDAKDAKDAKAAKTDDKSEKDKAEKASSAPKADEWAAKLDSQKKAIADLERELNLMEREHQVRVSVYYADAGNQLRDSKKWFEEEKKYEDDHAAKQKSVADAKQKLDDLQEQARKAGVPAAQIN